MKRTTIAMIVTLLVPWAVAATAFAQFGFTTTDFTGESSSKIAHIKFEPLIETPVKMIPLFGDKPPQSMKGMLRRLDKALKDPSVKAVIVDVNQMGMGFAQMRELHRTISDFKALDKRVYVHADFLTTGKYALATAADHISITPTGEVWLTGFYGETPYVKGMLDKIHVQADFLTCGDYKSAAEPLTRTGPSPEAQEMTDWLLDGIYESLIDMIAIGRDMKASKVKRLIDGGPLVAKDAKKAGLIDSVMHRQDFVEMLKGRYGESTDIVVNYGEEDPMEEIPEDFFGAVNFFMKMLNPGAKIYTEPSVAIVYVEGMIQTGSAEVSPFGATSGAFSTTIRKALDKAAADDTVKAVVLRIDSGGGSALASEIILEASKRVAAQKPLVVSMGNVAGSGGYYVACGAEAIFAEDATITGSIGVVGGKLVTTGGWKMLGINWVASQRGEMAALMSTAAPFSDEEREVIFSYMNDVYDTFKKHVIAARGDKLAKPIEDMAGGRVYTGQQALDLGLVDKLGGFEDAVSEAADRAGIAEYELRVIPEPLDVFEAMFSELREEEYAMTSATVRSSILDTPLFKALLPALNKIDPERASAVQWSLQLIDLVQSENVAVMMPSKLIVR